MKVAVPTRDGHVDDHFGHCDHYTVFTVEENKIVNEETLPSPQGCGCKSGVAKVLRDLGVEVMLAGSMGDGAKNKLEEQGISVIRGCSGAVGTLMKTYLAGYVLDSGTGCSSHEHHHECGHHECGNG